MQQPRLNYLFDRYLNNTCSVEERQELAALILNSQSDQKIMDLLEQEWHNTIQSADLSEEKAESIFNSITGHGIDQHQADTYVIPKTRRIFPWRFAAAASFIIMISIAAYFLLMPSKAVKPNQIAKTTAVPNDVAPPKSSNAVITLANGKQIILDSSGIGTLSTQGNVNIVKLANGQIAYNGSLTNPGEEISYNTLTNPKGSKVISLTLIDNSKVWLNAESSLRYPTGFTGNERKVELKGEAYFEIAKNSKMPFKVKVNDETEVDVTGTHFNINAYKNEENINTTLLEGSVTVLNGENTAVLKPGQQAQVNGVSRRSKIKVVNDVNVEKVMAWKNGVFNFEDAKLEEVMRQLERWYDIDVVYEKGIPQLEFMGKMGRDLTLSEVLHGLEVSKVHFRIEGRRLTVLP